MNLIEFHSDILNVIFNRYFDIFELYKLKCISKQFYYFLNKIIRNELAAQEKCQLEFVNRIDAKKDNIIFTDTMNNDENFVLFENIFVSGDNVVHKIDSDNNIKKWDARFLGNIRIIIGNKKYFCVRTGDPYFSNFDLYDNITFQFIKTIIIPQQYVVWNGFIGNYLARVSGAYKPIIYLYDLDDSLKLIRIYTNLDKIMSLTYTNDNYIFCFHPELIGIYDMSLNKTIFQIKGKFPDAVFDYPYLIIHRFPELIVHNIVSRFNKVIFKYNHLSVIRFYAYHHILFIRHGWGQKLNIYSLSSFIKIGELDLICGNDFGQLCVSDNHIIIQSYPNKITAISIK